MSIFHVRERIEWLIKGPSWAGRQAQAMGALERERGAAVTELGSLRAELEHLRPERDQLYAERDELRRRASAYHHLLLRRGVVYIQGGLMPPRLAALSTRGLLFGAVVWLDEQESNPQRFGDLGQSARLAAEAIAAAAGLCLVRKVTTRIGSGGNALAAAPATPDDLIQAPTAQAGLSEGILPVHAYLIETGS